MDRILGGSLCLALFVTVYTAPTTNTSPDDCKDHGISALGGVDCSALLNPNTPRDDINGVYEHRMFWCDENHRNDCCETCKIVLNSTNEEQTVENQPDIVNTHTTQKVQTETTSDKTTPTVPDKKVYYLDEKTNRKEPAFEIFVDMLKNTARQGIQSIDIKIFPNNR